MANIIVSLSAGEIVLALTGVEQELWAQLLSITFLAAILLVFLTVFAIYNLLTWSALAA